MFDFAISNPRFRHLTLDDWSLGAQCILFPNNISLSSIEIQGNTIHCSPRAQPLSALLHNKTKRKQILKNALTFQRHLATFDCTLRSCATAVNISQVTATNHTYPTYTSEECLRSSCCRLPWSFSVTDSGNQHVVVFSGYFTRSPEACAVTSIDGCPNDCKLTGQRDHPSPWSSTYL